MVDPCLPPLRNASFRGAGFFVDSDVGKYGRRIVTHEYPMRDDPFHEDMGRSTRTFNVQGYLYGPTAVILKDAIVAAAEARGSGILVLPAEAPFPARCILLSVTRSKDRLGWFDLSFEFRREGVSSIAPVAVAVFERLLSSTLHDATAAIADSYDAAFVGADTLPFVAENASGRIQAFADQAAFAAGAQGLDPIAAADVTQAAVSLTASADLLVSPVPRFTPGFVPGSTFQSGPQGGVSASEVVRRVGAIFDRLVNNMPPAVAVSALRPFTTFSVAEAPAKSTSNSDIADETNARLFNGTVRQLGLIAWAQALSAYDFTTRTAAIQARADVAEAFNREIETLGTNIVAILTVQAARDLIVKAIIEQITTLAPIIIVEAGATMPSLYWANRLYGDPLRAQELIDRNAVSNPSFMPTKFEALSR